MEVGSEESEAQKNEVSDQQMENQMEQEPEQQVQEQQEQEPEQQVQEQQEQQQNQQQQLNQHNEAVREMEEEDFASPNTGLRHRHAADASRDESDIRRVFSDPELSNRTLDGEKYTARTAKLSPRRSLGQEGDISSSSSAGNGSSKNDGSSNNNNDGSSSSSGGGGDAGRTKERSISSSGCLTGVTFTGERFLMPKTKNPLIIPPIREWKLFDYLKHSAFLPTVFLFMNMPAWFFVGQFIFWRLAYNVGLGVLLYHQSKSQLMTRLIQDLPKDNPLLAVIRRLISHDMGPSYDYDAVPPAFNAWLVWRRLVDIILAYDLATYLQFGLASFELPESFSFSVLLMYVLGVGLCMFALWAKRDSYRVVGDFAWYWGDFFFLVDQDLTFDRVFSISPHPMYTIGYAFYYGTAMLSQSWTVLYVSLFGHMCQLVFLASVEDPHIEKIYNPPRSVEDLDPQERERRERVEGYFSRDLIMFKNFNLLRSSDVTLVVLVAYTLVLNLLNLSTWFYVAQAVAWRCVHSFGLGYLLSRQSRHRFLTDLWERNGMEMREGFDNWKRIFNLSLVMTHTSFVCCCVKYADLGDIWNLKMLFLFKLTMGLLLIGLTGWCTRSSFRVVGEFGWFYGDFFIHDVSPAIQYTGVYRFLNNPESILGFAGYYGVALISDSWDCIYLALFCQACNYVFVRLVEEPHMKELYGSDRRVKAGVSTAMKDMVSEAVDKNPRLREVVTKSSDVKAKMEKRVSLMERQVHALLEDTVKKQVDQLRQKVEPLKQQISLVLPPRARSPQPPNADPNAVEVDGAGAE